MLCEETVYFTDDELNLPLKIYWKSRQFRINLWKWIFRKSKKNHLHQENLQVSDAEVISMNETDNNRNIEISTN